jgi:integrator complex subunit 3
VLQKAGRDDEMVQAELHEKCQQPAGHQHMIQALLFGMICDRVRCKDLLRYMTLIVKDNYQYCIKQLIILAHDKWPKMNDRNANTSQSQQQMQLVWLVKELVVLRVAGVDKICVSLLRQIQGGNVKSAANRWLATAMCTLFLENKAWLKELVQAETRLIAHIFYTFTRLAADHTDAKYEKMRRQEAQLSCDLFQEHFAECKVIGRDILRILQDVSKVEGFEKLLDTLLNNPAKFQGLKDVSELFNVKTNPAFLVSRLTPEMEKQLVFIMQHVKMGQQQRYQRWFMAKWDLSAPESETLIADLVRFVCCAHHPPNHVIRSEVVQRWAVVGWLLKCVKSPLGLANIKVPYCLFTASSLLLPVVASSRFSTTGCFRRAAVCDNLGTYEELTAA